MQEENVKDNKDTHEEKDKDTNDDKLSRIYSTIASTMDIDEFIEITPFSKLVSCHKNTITKMLEKIKPFKDINFDIITKKNGEIKGIIKTDEQMNIRKEIRKINKEITEIRKLVEKINHE